MSALPSDPAIHVTYQFQPRKCGKATCRRCQTGQGHGPYWYGYWRQGGVMRSGYVGKNASFHQDARPSKEGNSTLVESTLHQSMAEVRR